MVGIVSRAFSTSVVVVLASIILDPVAEAVRTDSLSHQAVSTGQKMSLVMDEQVATSSSQHETPKRQRVGFAVPEHEDGESKKVAKKVFRKKSGYNYEAPAVEGHRVLVLEDKLSKKEARVVKEALRQRDQPQPMIWAHEVLAEGLEEKIYSALSFFNFDQTNRKNLAKSDLQNLEKLLSSDVVDRLVVLRYGFDFKMRPYEKTDGKDDSNVTNEAFSALQKCLDEKAVNRLAIDFALLEKISEVDDRIEKMFGQCTDFKLKTDEQKDLYAKLRQDVKDQAAKIQDKDKELKAVKNEQEAETKKKNGHAKLEQPNANEESDKTREAAALEQKRNVLEAEMAELQGEKAERLRKKKKMEQVSNMGLIVEREQLFAEMFGFRQDIEPPKSESARIQLSEDVTAVSLDGSTVNVSMDNMIDVNSPSSYSKLGRNLLMQAVATCNVEEVDKCLANPWVMSKFFHGDAAGRDHDVLRIIHLKLDALEKSAAGRHHPQYQRCADVQQRLQAAAENMDWQAPAERHYDSADLVDERLRKAVIASIRAKVLEGLRDGQTSEADIEQMREELVEEQYLRPEISDRDFMEMLEPQIEESSKQFLGKHPKLKKVPSMEMSNIRKQIREENNYILEEVAEERREQTLQNQQNVDQAISEACAIFEKEKAGIQQEAATIAVESEAKHTPVANDKSLESATSITDSGSSSSAGHETQAVTKEQDPVSDDGEAVVVASETEKANTAPQRSCFPMPSKVKNFMQGFWGVFRKLGCSVFNREAVHA